MSWKDIILRLVYSLPGRTTAELAVALGGDKHRHTLGRRLPELEDAGRVHRGEQRTCEVSGRQATTWHPGPGLGRPRTRGCSRCCAAASSCSFYRPLGND